MTRKAATAATVPPAGHGGPIPFVQAAHFTPVAERAVDLVVIHSTEGAEVGGAARAVATWFAGKQAPNASAHYVVDNDAIVQCVKENDVAWHAPGANHNGVGIEHVGYARQSAAEWGDPYSSRELILSAGLAAGICARHGIPVAFVDAAGLVRGERGITTHAEVTKAFHGSTHTDPGPWFPMQVYLDMVRAAGSATVTTGTVTTLVDTIGAVPVPSAAASTNDVVLRVQGVAATEIDWCLSAVHVHLYAV